MTNDTPTPTTGPARYEFHVAGRIGPLVAAALPELIPFTRPGFTVLAGTFHDPTELQRLLDALGAHGLPVDDLRVIADSTTDSHADRRTT
jgi:hypothetical protein